MNMGLWWLQCLKSQDQLRFYWDSGSSNEDDYPTKHHPNIYYETKRPVHTEGAYGINFYMCID